MLVAGVSRGWPEVGRLRAVLPPGAQLEVMDPADADRALLPTTEAALVEGDAPQRVREFTAGRLCSRAALAGIGQRTDPVLMDAGGAPAWPDEVRASISHKDSLCVAVVGSTRTWSGVGIDVERAAPLPRSTWSRVLTAHERGLLEAGPRGSIAARATFSAKEAYYKWYRSCGHSGTPDFNDVDVSLLDDTVVVTPALDTDLPVARGRCVVGDTWIIALLYSEPIQPRS